jgi:tRNA pseudouridine38-40 synthase
LAVDPFSSRGTFFSGVDAMRIAVGIEYDGTGYVGWQRQKSGPGVQARVEDAIAVVANEPVEAVCAGRTDTGVHAAGQVVHFDTTADRSMRGWVLGINSNLPDDVNAIWATRVADDFHARFSAESRTYRYLILNRLVRSSLFRRRAWWVYEPLDDEAMQAAGQHLLGEHDFSAFRAAGCQASTPVRELTRLDVRRRGHWLEIRVTANAFLQHMVRNIVGTLVAIGRGDEAPDWAAEVLKSVDRTEAGVAAPPHGLTFMDVRYPASCGVPPADADSPGINVYDSLL